MQANWGGYNEPSAAFQAQCDVTLGGSRSFCDQLLPNPFFGVPGFEGTTRFTNPTLSRFELSRPFPAFTGFSTEPSSNDGKMTYDSAAVRRPTSAGRRASPSTPATPGCRAGPKTARTRRRHRQRLRRRRLLLKNDGPYFSQRKHRITASGVWELPWYRNQQERRSATCSAAGRSRRCSSSSRASRGTCRATSTSRRASISKTSRSAARRTGSSSTASSRASASATRRPATTICCPSRRPTAAPSRTS